MLRLLLVAALVTSILAVPIPADVENVEEVRVSLPESPSKVLDEVRSAVEDVQLATELPSRQFRDEMTTDAVMKVDSTEPVNIARSDLESLPELTSMSDDDGFWNFIVSADEKKLVPEGDSTVTTVEAIARSEDVEVTTLLPAFRNEMLDEAKAAVLSTEKVETDTKDAGKVFLTRSDMEMTTMNSRLQEEADTGRSEQIDTVQTIPKVQKVIHTKEKLRINNKISEESNVQKEPSTIFELRKQAGANDEPVTKIEELPEEEAVKESEVLKVLENDLAIGTETRVEPEPESEPEPQSEPEPEPEPELTMEKGSEVQVIEPESLALNVADAATQRSVEIVAEAKNSEVKVSEKKTEPVIRKDAESENTVETEVAPTVLKANIAVTRNVEKEKFGSLATSEETKAIPQEITASNTIQTSGKSVSSIPRAVTVTRRRIIRPVRITKFKPSPPRRRYRTYEAAPSVKSEVIITSNGRRPLNRQSFKQVFEDRRRLIMAHRRPGTRRS